MNIIEVKNLSFSYSSQEVLKNISFTAKRGDFIGLLGPNGSGKTTLAKIILGLLQNQKGKIKLLGQDIKIFDTHSEIGYLQQKISPSRMMPLSAFEIVRLGLLNTKKTPKIFNAQDDKKALKAMRTTRCYNFKDKLFTQLSGGQQQRVLLARTIINNPKLLILDEPSTALDSLSREMFFNLISRLNKEQDTTIILITHDISEVGKYVNKFLILDKKLIFFGDKQAFCASKEVGSYFGPFTQHLMDHLHTPQDCPFKEAA